MPSNAEQKSAVFDGEDMKLGLVAYAENTGLGNQTKAYYDNLKPTLTMVLDRSGSRENTFYPDRYPDNRMIVAGLPTHAECNTFLDAVDIVLVMEISPTRYLMYEASRRNIPVVLIPNYEYFHDVLRSANERPDFYLLPSKWHYDDFPDPKMYFPMPITPQIVDNPRKAALHFLHIAGRPIFPDRNGTASVVEALQYVQSEIVVTFRCQVPGAIKQLIGGYDQNIPPNVTMILDSEDHENTKELYADQDVLLMPRRFGGLCLPVNEAIGYGMPVIMSDISPNNQWLPKHWLVPAEKIAERKLAKVVDVYDADPEALAKMIDAFATKPEWLETSRVVARQMAQDYSWERLTPKLLEVLQSVLL